MSAPRPMKEILDELADQWGIPREEMMARVKSPNERRQNRLPEGLYQSRPVTAVEADEFNLPHDAVVLCHGDGTNQYGWLYVCPSSYKDKDNIERKTVTAVSYEYLTDVSVRRIREDPEHVPAVAQDKEPRSPRRWPKKRSGWN